MASQCAEPVWLGVGGNPGPCRLQPLSLWLCGDSPSLTHHFSLLVKALGCREWEVLSLNTAEGVGSIPPQTAGRSLTHRKLFQSCLQTQNYAHFQFSTFPRFQTNQQRETEREREEINKIHRNSHLCNCFWLCPVPTS